MNKDLTPENITNLVKESGYLMEQEVATVLENLGFVVQTNWAFQDQDEGKSRELDVMAFQLRYENPESAVFLCVELLCECKNMSTPLVFIERQKSPRDAHHVPAEYVFPFENYRKEMSTEQANTKSYFCDPPWRHWNLAAHHYFYSQPQKAVQFCKICRNGSKFEANHGGLFESLVYPLVKAVSSKIDEAKHMNKNNTSKTVTLLFPIVVIRSDLYLIDSQELDSIASQVPHVSLLRHIDSKTVKGEFLIDFVHENALANFVTNNVMPFVDSLAKMMEGEPLFFREEIIPIRKWDGKVD